MSIIKNIQWLCKKHGTSIPKIEKELGFSNGSVYNWDKNSPSVDKLQKVADHFKVSTDYLLYGFDWKLLVELVDMIKCGRTIEQFADDTGVDLNELDRICMGIILEPPSLETIEKIAADNPIDYIVGNESLFEAAGYYGVFEDKPVNKIKRDKLNLETYPVGQRVKVPIIGTVTAGPNGLAYEDYQGEEWVDTNLVNGGNFFYLRIKGDSMIGDGILPGDLALVRETPEVDYGALAIAIVNGEEGTIKRVYKNEDSIILQASNPKYKPLVFKKKEMDNVRIVGEVKMTMRNY